METATGGVVVVGEVYAQEHKLTSWSWWHRRADHCQTCPPPSWGGPHQMRTCGDTPPDQLTLDGGKIPSHTWIIVLATPTTQAINTPSLCIEHIALPRNSLTWAGKWLCTIWKSSLRGSDLLNWTFYLKLLHRSETQDFWEDGPRTHYEGWG